MKIPVFVSMPNTLDPSQDLKLRRVYGELDKLGFEARTVGKSDYPTEYPLREVFTLARHCSGGLVLGFKQLEVASGVWKRNTPFERKIDKKDVVFQPTPWNQIEAGILFSLQLPLLVFREQGISGGVFDNGVTDLFVHEMPSPSPSKDDKSKLSQVFNKWSAEVRRKYYALGLPIS